MLTLNCRSMTVVTMQQLRFSAWNDHKPELFSSTTIYPHGLLQSPIFSPIKVCCPKENSVHNKLSIIWCVSTSCLKSEKTTCPKISSLSSSFVNKRNFTHTYKNNNKIKSMIQWEKWLPTRLSFYCSSNYFSIQYPKNVYNHSFGSGIHCPNW
jgi:hypothetical protein